MKRITLPKYENVLDNEIFVQSPEDIYGEAKILRINKFRHPTLDEIMNYVSLEAKRLFYYSGEEEGFESNGLAELLKILPKDRLANLLNKNSVEIKKLKSYYNESYLQEGRNYLEFIKGSIPNPALIALLEVIRETGTNENAEHYELAIDKFRENNPKGDIFLRLDEWNLPKKEEIDILTSQFVRTSGALTFLEDFGNYRKAIKCLNFIYDNNFNEIIPHLKDYSQTQINSRAYNFVEPLAKNIAEDMLREGFDEMVERFIKDSEGEQKMPGDGKIFLN